MNRITVTASLLLLAAAAWAADGRYIMHVDGLACPYCAYGIEKKLGKIAGVGKIDIDLDQGIVTVAVRDGVELDAAAMHKLFEDAGFTLRSMVREPR